MNDTLFYLFEKHSLIYFEKAESIEDKNKLTKKFKNFYDNKNPIYIILDEPLIIFEQCINYLESIISKDDQKTKNKKMKKFFCLAYIRVYIYKFIHILKENPTRINENKIIEIINGGKETKLRFMIKLYLYKIIFNINGREIENLKQTKILEKYKLKNYKNFEALIESNEDESFLTQLLLSNEDLDNNNYEKIFLKIKSNEKKEFDNNDEINEIKHNIKEYKYDGDIFYTI